MTLSTNFTQKETKFFNYLIWYQQEKGPVTASYCWLAKKFGMSIEGIRQRIRKAKAHGFCERIRIGQTKWETFFTDKAIEFFTRKKAKHHPEHHPEPIRNPPHTLYIGKVKSNWLSKENENRGVIDPVFDKSEAAIFRQWMADEGLNPDAKGVREPSERDVMDFLTVTCGYTPEISEMALQGLKSAKTIKTNIWRYSLASAKKISYNIWEKTKRIQKNGSL